MKILLVEDDKTIASGLEYSLQQDGYATVLCHDVSSAHKVLAEGIDQFALCLFDLQLPDGSGYELCKMVKERRDIPVIFLTVIDDEVNVVMGLDMGADDYITKPFRVRELLSRIKSVLRRYQKPSQDRLGISFIADLRQSCWTGFDEESALRANLGRSRRIRERQYVNRVYQKAEGKAGG